MKKEDAKRVVSSVYNNLIRYIDKSDSQIDESKLIDFLHNIANDLLKNEFNSPLAEYSQRLSFDEEYKELAQQSIDSYSKTNDHVAALTKEQQTTLRQLNQAGDELSTPKDITHNLSMIQSRLGEEVERASHTINNLVKRIQELENKASIDPMTKVFNRRALDIYMGKIAQIKDHEVFMHVFMIDVDDFKSINDTHGHITGDKVLIFLANMFKATFRDGDKIFRYGGDEFIVVLNRINNEECTLVAERVLELVRKNKLMYKNKPIPVTLSIGATRFRLGDSTETLLDRADKALYRAKTMGKDRLEVES